MLTIEERLDRLEEDNKFLRKEYERMYHESELRSGVILKLSDWLMRYLAAVNKHVRLQVQDTELLTDVMKILDQDMQGHFKSHKYKDKKKWVDKVPF